MRSIILAVLLAFLAPGLLHAQPATTSALAPDARLAVQRLTIITSDGRRHAYKVEVAATPAQQERGLMFRGTMPRDRGMIFPMSPPRTATFWMENTLIPLDIIFIAPGGRVLNVGSGKPRSRDLVGSDGVVEAVLELNAGEAARIGLKPGDRVEWRAR